MGLITDILRNEASRRARGEIQRRQGDRQKQENERDIERAERDINQSEEPVYSSDLSAYNKSIFGFNPNGFFKAASNVNMPMLDMSLHFGQMNPNSLQFLRSIIGRY